jgi:hypothetical protein
MATKIWAISKEQSVADFSGSDRGNGKDDHAPVGLWTGVVFRDLMKFANIWTGVYQITKAELWVKRTGQVHVAFGATPRVLVRRLTAAFTENGGGENSWSTSATTVFGGPSTTATGEADSGVLGTGENAWSRWDITDIVEAWAPATVLKRSGSAGGAATNHGVKVFAYDEGSTARTTEFYSIRSSAANRPYIKLTYSDNAPPNAPTITSPVGSSTPEVIGTASGTEDTTAFGFSDTDAGDTCASVQAQYYDEFATDDGAGAITGGTLLKDLTATPTASGTPNAYTVKVIGLTARTGYRKRLRVKDDKGAWGAWTNLADGYVKTAYAVGVPLNPVMQTTPDSPHVFGTINSSDAGDYVTAWEGEFYRDNADGSTTTLWAPGDQSIGGSSTRSDITYAGTALTVGDVVRWRHRHTNRDGVVGTWSPFYSTVITAQTGPTTMAPADTSTKLTTRTPTFTITDAAAFTTYRYRLYRSGALVHDSGTVTVGSTTTVSPVIPTGVLSWGDGASGEMSWDASVRGETVSQALPFRVNSLPSTSLSASD